MGFLILVRQHLDTEMAHIFLRCKYKDHLLSLIEWFLKSWYNEHNSSISNDKNSNWKLYISILMSDQTHWLTWAVCITMLPTSYPYLLTNPDSKVHGANMGPIWGRQDPGGPHGGLMNFAIWECSLWESWRNLTYDYMNFLGPGLQRNFHV